jgi:HSP20 family molecular chaperone IbpA
MSAGVHRRDEIGSAVAAAGRAADVTTGGHAWPWGPFDVAVGTWSPAVDLIDRSDEVVVRADLPGFDREGVQLTAEPGVLHLRGVRRMNTDTMPGDSYHCVERWSGPFARTIRLPAEVDAAQMTATVTHGVLEVRVPKRVQAARETVEVRAEEAVPSAGVGRAASDAGSSFLPVRALYTA